jgi:phospho-N-acetylmuramoyl-pentapeptide-transferase
MGGLSFSLAILAVGGLLLIPLALQGIDVRRPLLVLIFAAANGAVGAVDDLAKLRKKKNEGLLPWQKLLLQTVFCAAFLALMRLYGDSTVLVLPFGLAALELGPLYYLFAMLFLLGSINFVNLTDGIDGLAASVSMILGIYFTAVGYLTSSAALLLLGSALFGGCLGFLFFNVNPAKVFMGDTGSLFLGGAVTGAAFIINEPMIILICGGVYVIEAISVILQVGYFKLTHGKRLFKCAPIHHHFEYCKWSEVTVVTVFSLTTAALCLLAWFGI